MNEKRNNSGRTLLRSAIFIGIAAGAAVIASCDTIREVTARTPAPTANLAAFRSEPELRVRLSKGAVEQEIGGPKKLIVRPVGTSPGKKTQVLAAPITIASSARGVSVLDARGAKHEWPFGVDVEILTTDGKSDGDIGAPSESLRVEGKRMPGFLTVRPKWSEAPATFDVIATMPIESYLPGVLTHELFKGWPRQAFEAQAIAARTYALHERARARSESRNVDVESTTADQVFGGSTTSAMANEAVRATEGLVLVCDGEILRAYFSSQCGGRPASAAEVWPSLSTHTFNKARPLQGAPRQAYCQRSSLYRWEVTRNDDDVNRRLRAWGRSAGHEVSALTRLRGVEALTRNDAGRPGKYVLTDDRGREYTLRAEELRLALNHPVADLPPVTAQNRINSGDVDVEIWANQVKFRGRGWGHGVGMCQWCAKGMGDAGLDWHSMLQEFYPGAQVKKAY